jgi:hypothetical protein
MNYKWFVVIILFFIGFILGAITMQESIDFINRTTDNLTLEYSECYAEWNTNFNMGNDLNINKFGIRFKCSNYELRHLLNVILEKELLKCEAK